MFCALSIINEYIAEEEINFYNNYFNIEKDMSIAKAEDLYEQAKEIMKTIQPHQSESDRLFNEIITHYYYITNYNVIRQQYHKMMNCALTYDINKAEKIMKYTEIFKSTLQDDRVVPKGFNKDDLNTMDQFTLQTIEELYKHIKTLVK